jgi:23S rRNA pseudouridine955/2504/2580 synthase
MSAALRTVSEDEAEIRLDRWFRRHFPGLTQGAIEKLCRTGQVRVNGGRVSAATRLLPGQAVRVPPKAAAEPADHVSRETLSTAPRPPVDPRDAEALLRRVLYRDDALIVLDKPFGLPVQGGPGITRHLDALLDALRFDADERPRLVHRLDRDTSGVLLLARTPGIAARLAALFRERDLRKTYWAVVAGRPLPAEGRIDLPLARISGLRGERTAPDPGGARAVTDYATLDHAGRRFAWLELSPLTGRTHQLRAHCAAIGTPILGDRSYGAAVDSAFPHLHLHARALALPHPLGGTLEVAAELPAHMKETARALGFATPAAPPPRRSR